MIQQVIAALGGYVTAAVDFDGSNDGVTHAGDLTGVAESKVGTFSGWIRLDGGDGSVQVILTNATNGGSGSAHIEFPAGIAISRWSNNKIYVRTGDPSALGTVFVDTVNTYTASATWLHILASWDADQADAKQSLLINGVSDKVVTLRQSITTAYQRGNDWGVGCWPEGSNGLKANMCMADIWFDDSYIDFTVQSNVEKFIIGGRPVFLGDDGSRPTGSQPALFFRRAPGAAASTFGTNLGGGGSFSITGTLDECSSNPS
jgi:hypothetical protein